MRARGFCGPSPSVEDSFLLLFPCAPFVLRTTAAPLTCCHALRAPGGSYFPRGIKYLTGGVASGFTHVEKEDLEPVLLRLKGRGNNTRLTQVVCKRE